MKDTTHFLNKLHSISILLNDILLVTLDVSSLYTNIPHTEGIQAARLHLHERTSKTPPTETVSANGHLTEHISEYVSNILNPLVSKLPSYIKDTAYFLYKLDSISILPNDILLVTLDVSSLYTNIPQKEGIQAARLHLDERTSKTPPTETVSANGHPTEHISGYVSNLLNPMVSKLPSYIKDTRHFLNKLDSIFTLPNDSLLVTLDVSSLYTNIPHTEGIQAARLHLDERTSKTPPTETVSANGHLTEHISEYVSNILNPLVSKLPSYIKDTAYFLNKLDSIFTLPNDTLLVTLDVSSLYTNIPQKEGIQAARLHLDERTSKTPPTETVSAIGHPTEHISEYVSNILNPLVSKLPSYVKDTTHFLNKLHSISILPNDILLVTLDVSSLYTNIPHTEGIQAARLHLHERTSKTPPTETVSANGHPTEHISEYVSNILNQLVSKLPSYIKDTAHFLNKLDSIFTLPNDYLLVTLDVSSLYTNIPHTEGIQAARLHLDERTSKTPPQKLFQLMAILQRTSQNTSATS